MKRIALMGEGARERVVKGVKGSVSGLETNIFSFSCVKKIPHLLYNDVIRLVYHVASITRAEVFLVKFVFLERSTYFFTNKRLVAIYPWVTISVLYVHIYTCIDASMNNELWNVCTRTGKETMHDSGQLMHFHFHELGIIA